MAASDYVQHKFDILLSIFLGIIVSIILWYYLSAPTVIIINKNANN